jgi:mxaA protein
MSNCSAFFRRQGIPLAALLVASMASPVLSQAQAILANDVIDPRSFGYVVGDKIRREVHLSVHADYHLDQASLPEPGRLDRWLEVAAPEVRVESIRSGRRYHLVLTYRILNAPPRPETITIPPQDLRLLGATDALSTLVPALRVTVVPVTSAIAANRLSGSSLQRDRPPLPIPVEARQSRLASTGIGLLALLLYAAWRHGLMAFIARRNLPFTKASRELKRLQPASGAPVQYYAAGLKIVHEAINSTAGRAVFAHTLNDFLAAHPAYAGLQADFDRFFAASGRVFFANAVADMPSGSAWRGLLHLCQRCSKIERRSFSVRSLVVLEKLHEPGV